MNTATVLRNLTTMQAPETVSPQLQQFIAREQQVAQVQQVRHYWTWKRSMAALAVTQDNPLTESMPCLCTCMQMIATLTDVCWDKCISAPGSSLSGKESNCLENCAKRFVEATQYVMQRAAHKAGASSDSLFS